MLFSTDIMRPSKSVAGFQLHIEPNGEEPAQVLTFMKDKTKIVNIGRKPTQTKHSAETADGTALFRCPVISRKHAQIALAESGSVYISDLKSHHGTYVQKPGEIVPRMIAPDTVTFLGDGDVVTFGKSVGRDETLVQPVVARVQFIFPVPSLPMTSATPSAVSSPGTPTRSGSTGRYGLASSPASYSSSSSDDESDIEELPAPSSFRSLANCTLPPILPACEPARLGLLRSFLPRIYPSEEADTIWNRYSPINVSSASPSRSPSVMEVEAPQPSQSQPEQSVVGAWPTVVTRETLAAQPVVLSPSSPIIDFDIIDCDNDHNHNQEDEGSQEYAHWLPADFIMDASHHRCVISSESRESSPHSEFMLHIPDEAMGAQPLQESDPASDIEQINIRIEEAQISTNNTEQRPTVEAAPVIKSPPVESQLTEVKTIVEAALKEIRAAFEVERKQEQEAIKAKFAEAEVLVAEAKALAQKHAETASSSTTLKRKRDELEEDEVYSSTPSATTHDAPSRPIKRQRSLAMRVVSGVAKTTAIAAVGAVATWSALAFS
ncbi:hypothetical protein BDW22DRAFT_1487629 [Trametopsis cervina]|nr:hypothetical protein BDW22DRAFT_1487629 [Trametopsis cervina]